MSENPLIIAAGAKDKLISMVRQLVGYGSFDSTANGLNKLYGKGRVLKRFLSVFLCKTISQTVPEQDAFNITLLSTLKRTSLHGNLEYCDSQAFPLTVNAEWEE